MKQWLTNIAQKALDLFVKFASTKAITALKDGFVLSMPATLVGSIFLLLANLPIPGYADFMAGHFGDNWNIGLNQINNATFSILAIIIAVGIGYSYARNEKMDGISCGILTLISFLIVSPSTLTVTSDTIKALGDKTAEVPGVLPTAWVGGNGIISAIIMGLIGSWVYTTCIRKNIRIKMPDVVPEGVSNAFSAMIPGFFIMLYSAAIYQVCKIFGGVSLTELIFKVIQTPLQSLTDNWVGAIVIVLLMSLLFWCGIHGPNVVSGIIYPVLTANSLVNQGLIDKGIKVTQANGGHYLVPQLIDCFAKYGGVGLTLGFIVCGLLFAKSAQIRELSKFALAPGIFNVNEPIIFGLPIVYNPIMLIPFMLGPLVAVILTYGSMVIGFLPAFGAMQVPWTTPPDHLRVPAWRMARRSHPTTDLHRLCRDLVPLRQDAGPDLRQGGIGQR
ncbi:PTS sugar transporter subunit IIC [Bifidobacterium tibiigranuli]|jgi:PTS system cellobiose-specific IIC component|uniref:PTS sugar transporter subunit IIC n=1 Tax=Bifidobacterium tibiigranuli TaxID=2172043 RepID=UPI0026F13673|nr:PTS transporter subunit EIIC [Bifidobacterium tibiigranuli]MCI1649286.1 PTS transporter subunit EIIC [Bifidobacterium tibiigranuli]MCI2184617.1 PTS transporter subunit EIIC [Bifidobacterium tibiigranuli]MCI2204810.1 PTS transporter subunit EIIC [Bifidobacterium tibiigranuli]